MEGYKYSRYFLFCLIRSAKRTVDGIYWCPFLGDLMMIEGSVNDTGYYYSRSMFMKKMYFDDEDIEIFMSKEKLDVDSAEFYEIAERFYETNKDLVNVDLRYRLPGKEFTLSELIDCYNYKYKH